MGTNSDSLASLFHDLANKLLYLKWVLETKKNGNEISQNRLESALSQIEFLADKIRLEVRQTPMPIYKQVTLPEVSSVLEEICREAGNFHTNLNMLIDDHAVKYERKATILFEATLFRQMIHNALDNARNCGASSVAIKLKPQGRRIQLLIEDDGPGFPNSSLCPFSPLGLGSRIIINNATRLLGKVSFQNKVNGGLGINCDFPLQYE